MQTSKNWIEPGTFGDMFGMVTCIFTGLSVIGLLATIHIQHKSLLQMRNDAKEQYKQSERHQFYTLARVIGKEWNASENNTHTEDLRKAIERALKSATDENNIYDAVCNIWNLAVHARTPIKQYNVIPYFLTVTDWFDEEEQRDILAATLGSLPDDLLLCMLILYYNGALPQNFVCKDEIINDNWFEKSFLNVYPEAIHYAKAARCVICQLKSVGKQNIGAHL